MENTMLPNPYRWISVDDGLPSRVDCCSTPVLVVRLDGAMSVEYYLYNTNSWCDDDFPPSNPMNTNPVTHWSALPTPPFGVCNGR